MTFFGSYLLFNKVQSLVNHSHILISHKNQPHFRLNRQFVRGLLKTSTIYSFEKEFELVWITTSYHRKSRHQWCYSSETAQETFGDWFMQDMPAFYMQVCSTFECPGVLGSVITSGITSRMSLIKTKRTERTLDIYTPLLWWSLSSFTFSKCGQIFHINILQNVLNQQKYQFPQDFSIF